VISKINNFIFCSFHSWSKILKKTFTGSHGLRGSLVLYDANTFDPSRKKDTQSYNRGDTKCLNEQHFSSLRDFEKSLYRILVSGRDSSVWLRLAKETKLSLMARARSAYLYSFLTDKMLQLPFDTKVNVGRF